MQFEFFHKGPARTPEQTIPKDIERAHGLAQKTLNEKGIRIEDFEGLYDTKKLDRDRERVIRKESNFVHESHKDYSDVLEAIIFDQIDSGAWFGENTRAIKTSKVDDYFNGSDIILELQDTMNTLTHLSLSIDVTFGTSTSKEKIADIKKNIDKGTLGQIDYFKSDRSQFRGEISQVPQVIIGVEKETVIKLATLWVDKHDGGDNPSAINEHPVKRLILSEILLQLYTFQKYAEETGKSEIAPIYKKDIQILEGILNKQGAVDTSSFRDDKVFAAIRESLKIFKTIK